MNIYIKDSAMMFPEMTLEIAAELIGQGKVLYALTDDDVYETVGEGEDAIGHLVISQKNIDKAYDHIRGMAYKEYADPVFFKYQRGDATKEGWLEAIAKVKSDFPRPTQETVA
jgi:hypothetical protein